MYYIFRESPLFCLANAVLFSCFGLSLIIQNSPRLQKTMSSVTDDDIRAYNAEKYRRYGDPGHGEFKYRGEEIDYGQFRHHFMESNRGARTNVKMCNYCFRGDVKLSQCSRCKDILYCSRKCQKKDWKRHKHICTPRSNALTESSLAKIGGFYAPDDTLKRIMDANAIDYLHHASAPARAVQRMMSQLYIGRIFVDEPSTIPVF